MQIHQGAYRRLQRYASRLFGGLDPELKKYAAEYRRGFPKLPEVSSKQELLSAIAQAQIVLCGDYHTLAQAQKTVIRLLREALSSANPPKKKPILALEMLQAKDKVLISRYLSGDLSEGAFLKAIRFSESWGFPWENYRPLFELAKAEGIEVVGINRASRRGREVSLLQRDRFAANVIAELALLEPDRAIYVLIGDLHLAPKHLPQEIERQLERRKISRTRVVIHQNEERYYWKLAEEERGHRVDVLKWPGNEFCVLSAPPWVKLQSHVQWVEKIIEEEHDEETYAAVEEDCAVLARTLVDFFQLPAEALELKVEGGAPGGLISQLKRGGKFSSRELSAVTAALKVFPSHFIPRENTAYLWRPSLNHVAAQTGMFLHAQLSGYDRVFVSPRQDFYPQVWSEALGFLGSKIINHKRKCSGPSDWEKEAQLPFDDSGERAQAYLEALRHVAEERSFLKTGDRRMSLVRFPEQAASETELTHYLRVAKLLGELLGEALYAGLVEHRVETAKVRELFLNSFSRPFEARRLYLDWIAFLDRYEYREVAKAERL